MWRRVWLRLGYFHQLLSSEVLEYEKFIGASLRLLHCFSWHLMLSLTAGYSTFVWISQKIPPNICTYTQLNNILTPFCLTHFIHKMCFTTFFTSYSICSIMHKKLSQCPLSSTRTSAAVTFYLPLKSFLVSTSASSQCGVLAGACGQSHWWLGSRLPHCSAATAASRDYQSGIWLEL